MSQSYDTKESPTISNVGRKLDFTKLPDRIAIVGSRSFADSKQGTTKLLTEIHRFVSKLGATTIVVSGGARGVDEWAARMAQFCNKELPKIYWPDRSVPSPRRFFARNTQIVDDVAAHGGIVVAFCDPLSWNGTKDTIRKALDKNLPVVILFYTQEGEYVRRQSYNFERYLTQ